MGICPEEYEKLASEVDVVINVAASVDFILRLDLNMKINVIGALNALYFAQDCKNLAALCHVST